MISIGTSEVAIFVETITRPDIELMSSGLTHRSLVYCTHIKNWIPQHEESIRCGSRACPTTGTTEVLWTGSGNEIVSKFIHFRNSMMC